MCVCTCARVCVGVGVGVLCVFVCVCMCVCVWGETKEEGECEKMLMTTLCFRDSQTSIFNKPDKKSR